MKRDDTLRALQKYRESKRESRQIQFPAGLCTNAYLVRSRNSPDRFYARCGACQGCLNMARDAVIGGAIGEAITSAATLTLTLTYRDVLLPDGSMGPPDAALYPDPRHWRGFKEALARAGYDVRSIRNVEFGERNGRVHYHCILFFQRTAEDLEEWQRHFVDTASIHGVQRTYWQDRVPPLEILRGRLSPQEFRAVREDPSKLVVYESGQNVNRQSWSFWPHGDVQAGLLKSDFVFDVDAVGKAVAYATKYQFKDPWRGSKKWRNVAFDRLPDWVQETTAWHFDNGHWVHGNPYRDQVIAKRDQYMREEGLEDESLVPDDLRVRTVQRFRSPHGGTGAAYLQALAKRRARLGANMVFRQFAFRQPDRRSDEKASLGERAFYMSDTQFVTFGQAFIDECRRLGREPNGEGFQSYFALVRQREETALRNSGPIGYRQINECKDLAARETLIEHWGTMPLASLKGIVPKPWIEAWCDEPPTDGWRDRAAERDAADVLGRLTSRWKLPDGGCLEFYRTGAILYHRDLKPGDRWWSRDIFNVAEFEAVLAGRLLPSEAKSERIAQEAGWDETPLGTKRHDWRERRLRKAGAIRVV